GGGRCGSAGGEGGGGGGGGNRARPGGAWERERGGWGPGLPGQELMGQEPRGQESRGRVGTDRPQRRGDGAGRRARCPAISASSRESGQVSCRMSRPPCAT